MKVKLPSGKYVVAVSGGVDSMVLLDMLSKMPDIGLVVAHFDHGIREDSAKDTLFVAKAAGQYGLDFVATDANLGSKSSEVQARAARYEFLENVKKTRSAKAIITAHHQDDLLETAIINLLRGTGRRGLTSIADNQDIIRPLLGVTKTELIKYAKQYKIRWREDMTNQDTKFLRNYVRKNIIPKLSKRQRQIFLSNIDNISRLNPMLEKEIAKISQTLDNDSQIDRQKFTGLPPEVANEVLMYILRQKGLREFNKKTINRLSLAIKTAKPGTKHNIYSGNNLLISSSSAQLVTDVN